MSLNAAMMRVGAGAAAAARGSLATPSCGAALAVTGRRSLTTFQERYICARGCATLTKRADIFFVLFLHQCCALYFFAPGDEGVGSFLRRLPPKEELPCVL